MVWKLDADQIKSISPNHILFLCVANSARSQMAEGIAKKIVMGKVKIYSAGSKPSQVNPLAIMALLEIDIDISEHFSKRVDTIDSVGVDVVITLCAEEECPVFLGNAKRFHWGLPDPTDEIESFRSVRDELVKRLTYLFEEI